MALGSGAGSMIWMVAKEALRLVAAGCIAGIVIAIAAGRLISANLYGVSPADPTTIAGAAALMLIIAVIAVLGPALRAARIDPLIALHCE
jgi:ABC-type antimicrobial peptide transport system permease subunit